MSYVVSCLLLKGVCCADVARLHYGVIQFRSYSYMPAQCLNSTVETSLNHVYIKDKHQVTILYTSTPHAH